MRINELGPRLLQPVQKKKAVKMMEDKDRQVRQIRVQDVDMRLGFVWDTHDKTMLKITIIQAKIII